MHALRASLLLITWFALTGCGGGGGSSGSAGTLETEDPPTAVISVSSGNGFTGIEITFDGLGSDPGASSITQYLWQFGDGQSSADAVAQHAYQQAGQYSVTLTVTNLDGSSDTSSATLVIAENQAPTASIIASDTVGRTPLDGTFSVVIRDDQQSHRIDWDFGDGTRINDAGSGAVNHRFTQPGEFPVSVEVTDEGGLSVVDTKVISVLNDQTHTFSGSIIPLANTLIDSDIADPNHPNIPNNSFEEAQPLPAIANIAGYASFATDRFDYFGVTLEGGQTVVLEIGDWVDALSSADLDIQLFDANNQMLLAESRGTSRYEIFTTPYGGDFYIRVEAWSGDSSYGLSVGGDESVAAVARKTTDASTDFDFVEGELLVVRTQQAKTGMLSIAGSGRLERITLPIQSSRSLSATSADEDVATISSELEAKHQTLMQLKAMRQSGDYDLVSLNYRRWPSLIPNDEFFGLQWHYSLINLPGAWDLSTGRPEVVVAVLDTGIFQSHPDLAPRLTADGYDFVSNVSNAGDGDGIDPDPQDPGDSSGVSGSSWHGTHVAGTIGAQTNNGIGIAGVSWGASVMNLRVLGQNGGNDYDILQALLYAAGLPNDSGTLPSRRADVVNMSLGGPGFSQAFQNAVTQARAQGVIVIAAAGNDASAVPSYPASLDGVVSVSAVGASGDISPYSNFGADIDVAAPGGNQFQDLAGDGYGDGVLSTMVDDRDAPVLTPAYAFYQGTSMAAPHVAGVAALMRSVNPDFTPAEFDALLASGQLTRDLGPSGRDDLYGHGLIDAFQAVNAAQSLSGQPLAAYVNPSLSSIALGYVGTTAGFTLIREGAGALSILSLTVDRSWLSVADVGTDAEGFGDYLVTVDRDQVGVGRHEGIISIIDSQSREYLIQISFINGDQQTLDNGVLYLIFVDANSNSTVYQQNVFAINGEFEFSLEDIVSGEYFVYAGTDVDNDLRLCDSGELCGGYPSLEAIAPIIINQSLSDIQLTVELTRFVEANLLGNPVSLVHPGARRKSED